MNEREKTFIQLRISRFSPFGRIRTFSEQISLALAGITGWQVEMAQPLPEKCVIIGAYHTSAWDLFYTLILKFSKKLNFHWIAKDTLFRGPMGFIMRSLGGIPVNRRSRNNYVEQMVSAFECNDTLQIAIMPEGTRSHSRYWKTGFYYIAQGARVPIVMGYADYRRKIVGLGPILMPTGDIEADFETIRTFYTNVTAKYPHKQSEIKLRPLS